MPKAPEPSSTCQKTTKSLPRISPKSYCYNAVPNRFLAHFSTSRTSALRSLSQVKVTHSALLKGSHTAAYTPKQRAFWMGALLLPSERFARFGNSAWPGGRTANFAAFGSWSGVLPKNAESLGTAMRSCASLSRGIAAPLGCVIFFASVEIATCMPCTHVRGRGGITTPGVLRVLPKRRTAACQSD